MELSTDWAIQDVIDEYSVDQDYDHYTTEDQGTWSIATNELESVLVGNTAVSYVESFNATGMSKDRIPSLAGVDLALSKVGWSAVVVDGFIPPDVFMLFQANSILPISRPIRPRSQMDYTPIPDIIHEAAGHLPMLSSEEYRVFLQRLGEIGASTHLNDLDMKLYQLGKTLAELMADEPEDTSCIDEAQRAIQEANAEVRDVEVSAARKVARFHWWTVEYGLIGPGHDIFGAGLLSSVAEAREFRNVPHRRLDLRCCDQDFAIDHVQPQYYVADSWSHLMTVVDELGELVATT